MDGYNIQKYERVKELAASYGVVVEARGEHICFSRNKSLLGCVRTVDEAHAYVTGFSAGWDTAE